MNCEQAKPLLMDLVLDEMEYDAVRRELEAHVAGCEGCRRELTNWKMTRSLVAQGVPQEDPPHRIRFVAAERRRALAWLWAPGFRLPLGLGAAAALVVMVLALSGAHVTVGQGRFEIALGRHAAAPERVLPQPHPGNAVSALPSSVPAGQQAFTRDEVQRIVAAAVERSEQRQREAMASLVGTTLSRVEREHRNTLETIAGEVNYLEKTQNMFYKDSVNTQAQLLAIASRIPQETRQ